MGGSPLTRKLWMLGTRRLSPRRSNAISIRTRRSGKGPRRSLPMSCGQRPPFSLFPMRNWPREHCALSLSSRSRPMTADAQSPVSFMFQVNRLPKNGADVTLEADEAQRAELARIHDLLSVEAFTAELSVKKWKADGVMVKGRVRARITQQCVVTLDPILSHIDEEITAIFVPETSKLARH